MFTKNPPNKKNINQRINNNQKENKSSYISMTTQSKNKKEKEIVKKAKEIISYNDEEMNSL